MNQAQLRALSILHELTVTALDLFNTAEPLERFLLKMASRLNARVILLWQAPPSGGLSLLGSAGLSRHSRQHYSLAELRLEDLDHRPEHSLPYPECQGAELSFYSLQLGPEHSEYGMTLCFGLAPSPWLRGSLHQLGQSLFRMLEHRSLQDHSLHTSSQLQTVLSASPDGILLLNQAGTVLQGNRAAEQLLDLPHSTLLQRQLRELLPRAESQYLHTLLNHPGDARLGQFYEGWYQGRGERRRLAMSLSHVPLSDPPMFAFQFRDVTQQRAEQQHLRETKARLETLIEHLQAGVLMENGRRQMLLVNQAFCDMFGVPLAPEKLIGSDCGEASRQSAVLFQDSAAFLERITAILAQGTGVSGDIVEMRDGRCLSRDYVPIRHDHELIGHLWVYRDVSENRRLEKEREALARLPDESPNPVLRVGFDGLIQYANIPAMYLLWYLNREVGERLDGEMLEMAQACIAQDSLLVRELTFGRRVYQLVWAPISDQAYLNLYATDITTRRQAEADAMRARDEVLNAAAAKSAFLTLMSHEIRTPLNALLGSLELLQNTPLSPQQQGYLSSSAQASQHLRALLNQALDFSLLESGQLILEPVVFSLREMAEQCLKRFQQRAETQGIEMTHSLDLKTPQMFRGDAQRLQEIIALLLDNALKFTAEGRVSLELLDARQPEPSPAADWLLCFRISDTGLGIAPEQREQIEARLQATETALAPPSSGLGLSIVSRLVALFQGRVWLESTPGQGSQFYFTVRLGSAETPILRPPPPPPQQGAWQILIAEDLLENRMLLKAYLQEHPYVLHYAETGREAVDAWRQLTPDLILMDVQMPDMDGIEAIQVIRADSQRRQVPILALTADAQSRTHQACLAAGFNAVLNKPLSQQNLLQALHQHLQHPDSQAQPAPTAAPIAAPAPSKRPPSPRPKRALPRKAPALAATLPDGVPAELAALVSSDWRRIPEVAELLPLFLQQRQPEPEQIAALLANEDFQGLANLGHGMKGCGSSFGFDTISALGEALEGFAQRRDQKRIAGLERAYRYYLERIAAEIGAACTRSDT
ncbi:MAG: response regulator [Candidatus Sericytochromatia bacterium]